MIPYDDLVVALASWRARQGLPVAPSSGVPQARAQVVTPTVPRPAVQAPAAPRATPPSAPPRAMPLPAPPGSGGSGSDMDDDGDDIDGAALIEDSVYDPSGDDYVVPLGEAGIEPIGEPTAIGGAPEMPKRGKRPHDW
jgi:hypothetical protein